MGKHYISLDNGYSFMTAAEAMPEIRERNMWDTVVWYMDDETREAIQFDLAPCTDEEFLSAYLERAEDDLIIG